METEGDHRISKLDIALWWIPYQDIILEQAEDMDEFRQEDDDSSLAHWGRIYGLK